MAKYFSICKAVLNEHSGLFCLLMLLTLSVLFIPGIRFVDAQSQSADSEVTTEELKQIFIEGKIPVIDVRPEKEYEVSHVPGSDNIFETEIDRMTEVCAKSGGIVLYCNGPYCGKTNRVSANLSKNGCVNIKRYQEGMPLWRAFGNTAETTLDGFKYVFSSDKTAFFIDARSKDEFNSGSMPGANNLQADEIDAANDDGRLPYSDHGTRVIVFGKTIEQARQLAEALARRAYWNGSYLAVTYEELKQAGLW